MKKIVLTFGLISGAIMSVIMSVTIPFHDQVSNEYGMVIGYSSMILSGLLIYFGIRQYRDTVNGGAIKFWRAAKVGALIAFIAATCYVATWEVLSHTVVTGYMEEYSARMLESERAAGATPEAIEAKRAEMAKWTELYKNPLISVAITYLEPLPVALIMVFGSAGLLSRKKRDEDSMATA